MTPTTTTDQCALPWESSRPDRRRNLVAVPTPTWTDDDATDDLEVASSRPGLTVAREAQVGHDHPSAHHLPTPGTG